MLLRNLPRYATDLRVLGVTDTTYTPMGFAAPVFPHVAGDGDGGGGAAGGTGGDDSTDDSDGTDDEGSKKSLAEMTDAEKAEFWKKQARATERKLKGAPRADELEKLKAAAKELEKIQDSQRTDSEKATARAEAAEKELADLKPKFERLEVAYEKGLPPNLAKRLTGGTREEMEADADELLAEFGDAIRKDSAATAAKDKEKRTAARKGAAGDAGPRGNREDTKPSVASGAELFAARKAKKTPAAA